MSTVKFDLQDDIEELRAKIFLDTKKRLSKKDVLELVFRIGAKNYDQILQELQSSKQVIDKKTMDTILELLEDFGPTSENLSELVNTVCYQTK